MIVSVAAPINACNKFVWFVQEGVSDDVGSSGATLMKIMGVDCPCRKMVERRRIELPTSALRTQRSPS